MTKNSDADAPKPLDNTGDPRKYAPRGRGRPFAKGNPGKPKGAKNKTTLAVEILLNGEAERLTRKAIKLALAGDAALMRLCMERIAPVRKGRAAPFAMPPPIKTTGDIVNALASITEAVASGQLSPEEAHQLAGVLEVQRKAIETQDLEIRLHALEKRFEQ